MNALFPSGDFTFQRVSIDGAPIGEPWRATELNLKTKVVCGDCNNGWMSSIESQYAKPAMSDLILGKRIGALSKKRATGLTLFAFKTAVIADSTLPEKDVFFSKSHRYAFRKSLTIPRGVTMWLFGIAPNTRGSLRTHSVHLGTEYSLNVCSFAIGQLGFQVVSVRSTRPRRLLGSPTPGLTFSFYPTLEPRISWPRNNPLGMEAFNVLANRWNKVREG